MVSHFNTAMMSAKGGKIATGKGSAKGLLTIAILAVVGYFAFKYFKKNNVKTTQITPEDEY
jgi:hypothetical protein